MSQVEMDTDQFNSEVKELIEMSLKFKPPKPELLEDDDDDDDWFMDPQPSASDKRLATVIEFLVSYLKKCSSKIANKDPKVIEECSECIQRVLLCLPPNRKPDVEWVNVVDKGYLKLLDTLAEVNFPVTSIVNHVMVVVLQKISNTYEYFNQIMSPDDNTKLNYFLKHGHDPQEGFSLKGFRLSDLLLAEFSHHNCPRALLDILRYGCSDLLRKKSLELKRHKQREVGVTPVSEYKLLDALQFVLSSVKYHSDPESKQFQSNVDRVKIIFRSLYSFSFEFLHELNEFAQFISFEEFKDHGMKFLKKTDKFPELNERLGETTPSLKHLCRLEIRKTLYKNWALPDGIRSLGIPRHLEEFLDLKTD